MIELKNLQDHLKAIRPEDWSRLFDLIPEMNPDKSFGKSGSMERQTHGAFTTPYYGSSAIVSKFLETVYGLDIIPAFDWTKWTEGKDILENKNQDYGLLDATSICKLLTIIVRSDRFAEGTLMGCFENGLIQRMLIALKAKVGYSAS